MGKVKQYNFLDLPKVTASLSLEELKKRNKEQVEAQLKGKEELQRLEGQRIFTGNPLQDAIGTAVINAVEQPFKTIEKGIKQLGHPRIPNSGTNPIAGAINLATGIAEVPMLIGTVPISGVLAGLDEIGLKKVTEPINKTFETIQEAPKNIAQEITEALEENGTATKIRNFVDMKNREFGVSQTPLRIEEQKANEIKESVNNLTGLSAIVGATVGAGQVAGGLVKNAKLQTKLGKMGYTKTEISKMNPKLAEKIVEKRLKEDAKKEIETYVKEKVDITKIADEVTKKQFEDFNKEILPEKQTTPDLGESPKADIPFMITKQMESDLLKRGISQENINRMTPEEANTALKEMAQQDEVFKQPEKITESQVSEKPTEIIPEEIKTPKVEEVLTKEAPKEAEIKQAEKELNTSSADPEIIGITKVKLNELSKKIGLEEIKKVATQHIPDVNSRIIPEIEQGLRTPQTLLAELRSGKRTDTQPFETTYFLERENQIWERNIERLREARADGNKALEKIYELQAEESLGIMKSLIDTFNQTGSDIGRYFRFMQEGRAKDFSIARLMQRAEVVAPDGKVLAETKTQLENYAYELGKVQEALNKYQTKYPSRTIDDFIKDIERRQAFEQRKTKRAVSLSELKAEREVLWADLYKITGNLSANPFVNPEAIKKAGLLMENYVRAGIKTAEGIIDEFYNGFKGQVSKEDIMKALSGYGRQNKQPTKDEVKTNLQNAKREMKLLLQIEDAKKGIVQGGKKQSVQTERIKTLQQILNKTKKENIDISDAQKLKAQKTRVLNNIKEYERRLREGDYTKKISKPVQADAELTNLKVKERQLRQQIELVIYKEKRRKMTKGEKFREELVKIANIPRTLLATADLSMPLRQGLPASSAHPKIAYEAFKEMHLSAGSKKHFDELMTKIENSPYARIMEKMGIQFTGIGDDLIALAKKEEAFIGSGILSRIPFIKETLGTLTEFSERGAVAYLNYMRWKIAEKHAKLMEARGLTVENSPKAYKDVGNVINWGTGRADLGMFERIPGFANAVLFSPRTLVAKWELMNPVNYFKLSRDAQRLFWRQQMSTVAQGVMFLNLMKLAGADVETDPRSSDFAKARFGNTRIDIMGGQQQNFVLMTRVAFGLFGAENMKRTSTGELAEKNIGMLLLDYARNKLSPQASIGADLLFGERYETGDESFGQNFYERMMPLVWQDMLEAQTELGWGAIGTTLLGFYGAGTQTFKPEEKEIKFNNKELRFDFNFNFDFKEER